MNGYTGRVLMANLSTGQVGTLALPQAAYDAYVGGRGLAARLLWDCGAWFTQPLDERSSLVFAPGALTGTNVPSSGRTTVAFRSPATGLYFKSVGGAHWGAALKFAGYDGIVVVGKASVPVFLWIDDSAVEIRDAGHLWGRSIPDVVESFEGNPEFRGAEVASIGPAGERLVVFAGIAFSSHSFAARGGGGAVMGSKNLKAVVVRGSGEIAVADPEALIPRSIAASIQLGSSEARKRLAMYGTSGLIPVRNEMHLLPARNYQAVYTRDAHKVSGQYLREAGYLVARAGCFQCGTACHRFTRVASGRYAGTASAGPEFETAASLGLGCGITDTGALLKANEVCNSLGLDTISAGGVIQWAIESYERGTITEADTGGLAPSWGDADCVIRLLELIGARDGIGDLLARGVRRASEIVGHDSWKWASQVKGLETSRAELRARKGYALALAVNPRGPDHLTSQVYAEFGATPEARALIRRICGDERYANAHIIDKRAHIVKWHESCYAASDSMGLCTFATLGHGYLVGPERMAEFYGLVTGGSLSGDDVLAVGERVFNLEKAFNVLCGARRCDDHIPWRFMNEPIPTGPCAGLTTSADEMNAMLSEYYQLHGWDPATGIPSRATLERLGLRDVAQRLEGASGARDATTP